MFAIVVAGHIASFSPETSRIEPLAHSTAISASRQSVGSASAAFGSKDGLVAALAAHAFDLLEAGVEALPTTDDPRANLVDAGAVLRSFALQHPSLFHIAVQRTAIAPALAARFRPAAQRAFAVPRTASHDSAHKACWVAAHFTTPRVSSTRSAKAWPP